VGPQGASSGRRNKGLEEKDRPSPEGKRCPKLARETPLKGLTSKKGNGHTNLLGGRGKEI